MGDLGGTQTRHRPGLQQRDEPRRHASAERASKELGLAATAAPSAQAAVAVADIVILATNSAEPVIRTDWHAPGCHAAGPTTPTAPSTLSVGLAGTEVAPAARLLT